MIQCIDDETVIALQFIPKMLEVVALILSKQKIILSGLFSSPSLSTI